MLRAAHGLTTHGWTALALAALLTPLTARAQDDDRVPAPLENRSEFARCFGVPDDPVVHTGGIGYIPGPVYIGGGGEGGHSSGSGGNINLGSGDSDGKAMLVVAVVALAALPVVIWVFDSPAPRVVALRHECPTFNVSLVGGSLASHNAFGRDVYGRTDVRLGFARGPVGFDFDFGFGTSSYGTWGTHFPLRPDAKNHVDLAVSLGYRRMFLRGISEEGFEFGLPHTYTFWRDGLTSFGLELRPMLLAADQGIEPSLEGAVLIPLFEVLQGRVGAKVFTFQGNV
ncbi:MAG: hypothetical protein JST92_24475, partial [Deltaproteobacteria bacterium]|nr:hypothetical protein [Deltaproteobacteria bacterium]